MQDPRNSKGGIRDENSLAGSEALISIGGMWVRFEIDGGMRDFNSKRSFERLSVWGWDKDCESGGMAERSQD